MPHVAATEGIVQIRESVADSVLKMVLTSIVSTANTLQIGNPVDP
jgi:hypothetical protein